MRIIHTADWHIGQYKGPVVNGENARFTDIKNRLAQLVEEVTVSHSDLVIIAGDIFNQAEIQARRASEEELLAADTIIKLSESADDVIVLRGTPNHDGSGQFDVLKGILAPHKHIHVVTEPTVIETRAADVACIPGFDKQEFRAKFPGLNAEEENIQWTQEIGSIVMGLKALCSRHPSILTAHYTVPGCNMESGQTSFFSNFEPVIPREVLQAADFDAVMLGHIHRPQQINGLRSVYYSGSIEQLNFNDEGQDRGYYVHYFDEFKDRTKDDAIFLSLNPRQHSTIKWNDDDVVDYLRDGKLSLAKYKIMDNIVRIKYSCTDEHKKALNIPQLQSDLEALGAFYVSEISADNIMEVNNRGLLSEESDPVKNLRKWLEEKCIKDAAEVADLGQPIIETAVAMQTKSHVHGVFQPVSIHVKNYRNYAEETFSFDGISFCTINGVNGAGKSSLFMDAIIDALYEEPREGDLKGWIRATPDARSGMIEFIFDIGSQRFRIVRTRVKSGKATLNFSELVDGEWENRGGEKISQTQDAIIDVIGMDSMTFKSCALIMQDQYGLFLQAPKEDRMTILGTLLGLGVYSTMEAMAIQKRAESRRSLSESQTAVTLREQEKSKYDDPEKALKDIEAQISDLTADQEKLKADKKAAEEAYQKTLLITRQIIDLHSSIENMESQIAGVTFNINHEKIEADKIREKLSGADEIHQKADQYRQKVQEAADLKPMMERVDALKNRVDELRKAEFEARQKLEAAVLRKSTYEKKASEISAGLKESHPEELKEIDDTRKLLDIERSKKEKEAGIERQIEGFRSGQDLKIKDLQGRIAHLQSELHRCRKQKEYMEHSGCLDIGKANCKFLASASADVKSIPELEGSIQEYTDSIEFEKTTTEETIEAFKSQIETIGFNEETLTNLTEKLKRLEGYESIERENASLRTQMASLASKITETVNSIDELTETDRRAYKALTEAVETLNSFGDIAQQYQTLTEEAAALKKFADQESELPLLEQKLEFSHQKLLSYDEELGKRNIDLEKLKRQLKMAEDERAQNIGSEDAVKVVDDGLATITASLNSLMVRKGTLTEQVERVHEIESDIAALKEKSEGQAIILNRYEVLAKAFSQDGVPHQIIRNIIPHIENTANAILSSMTGGTMGVQFVLDKVVKGRDGEKATLDVMIEEYGKTTLPYASKSGGEKVKASLAVILALSEIKSSSAGLSMGMLFIDEPPFLDDDGTQAYVDALETIRKRYKDTKIMAITHDAAMKARFDQSITIVKDEGGSRVVYD